MVDYSLFKEDVEGLCKILVPRDSKVSRDLPVFFNSAMKHNRDLSIILLNCLNRDDFKISLPLAGTGVRGVRFLKELPPKFIKSIHFNDCSSDALDLIKKNLKLNKVIIKDKVFFSKNDASKFLLDSSMFNYIDIDPFGPPGPFLDAAVRRIVRGGVLAVTATDTGALCGSFPKACRRKYWAESRKTPIMHETGLRILIRKVQLFASQYEVALNPIFSYSKDHYMRVFFSVKNGKSVVDKVLKQHKFHGEIGPLWFGKLFDASLVSSMNEFAKSAEQFSSDSALIKFLELLNSESTFDFGFYDLHALAKSLKLSGCPSFDIVEKELISQGFTFSRTHFSRYGMKSNVSEEKLIKILKKL